MNKFRANQQQFAIGATSSACEGSLANHPDETLQAERRIGGRRVQASRKRLENERVAEEALAQKKIRGEAKLAGALPYGASNL